MLNGIREAVGGTGIILLLVVSVNASDELPQSVTPKPANPFEVEAMTIAMQHVGRLLEALEGDELKGSWAKRTETEAKRELARREGCYRGWKAMIKNVDAAIFVSVDTHGPHVMVGHGGRGGYPFRSHRDPDFREGYNMWEEQAAQLNRSLRVEASGKQVALERLLRSGLSLEEAKEKTLVNYRAVMILRRLSIFTLPQSVLEETKQEANSGDD